MTARGAVLVTPRSLTRDPPPELDRLREAGYEVVLSAAGRQPTEDELLALVPGCVAYLAGVEPVTAAVIGAGRELRVISRNGVGIDNIDLASAEARGIEVRRAAGANSRGVAELALTLMMAGLRHVPAMDAAISRGKWERHQGREAVGRTLGIVGMGLIGATVAELAEAIGMRTIAFDPFPKEDLLAGGTEFVGLDDLFARADVISLHAPAPQDGRAIVTADLLASARPGLVLINTARAALVDENAVLEALSSGRLGSYATDVYAVEPPPPSWLLEHPAVISTPHVGGYTVESVKRATNAAIDGILEVLREPSAG